MKLLVYAIGRSAGEWHRLRPIGSQGAAVGLLCEGELAAAFCGVADAGLSPSTSDLLAYARIIEQLHRHGPVLPMRYGCRLEGEASIRDLLRVRRGDFLAALAEVDGCDEFGLRILLSDQACPPTSEADSGGTSRCPLSPARGVGARYLAERNKRFIEKDARGKHGADAAERWRAAFQGLFVRCEHEPAADSASMASLHFLVPRENHGRFQAAFRDRQQQSADKLLLTGPWPPYHFVTAQADK